MKYEMLRCPMLYHPPLVNHDADKMLWKVQCECAQAVGWCQGHTTFEEAVKHWNGYVEEFNQSIDKTAYEA